MPGTANYSLLILFEDEIRTAATLLIEGHAKRLAPTATQRPTPRGAA